MNRKLLIDLIAGLLLALVVVVGYKLSPVLLPPVDEVAYPDPACDLRRESCAAALTGGGKVVLSFGERAVPVMAPFALGVRTEGLPPGKVAVDFDGIDMKMGLNRPPLIARGEGVYAGEATLPLCVTGQMDWQATVLVEAAGRRIAVPYRFVTGK